MELCLKSVMLQHNCKGAVRQPEIFETISVKGVIK